MRWAFLQKGGLARGLSAEQSDKGFYAAMACRSDPDHRMEVKHAGADSAGCWSLSG